MTLEKKFTVEDLDYYHLHRSRSLHNDWEVYENDYIKTIVRENYNSNEMSISYFEVVKDYQLMLYGKEEWNKLKK